MARKRKATGAAAAAGKRAKKTEQSHEDGADELVKRKLARKHGEEAAFQVPDKPKVERHEPAPVEDDEEKPRWVEINRAPVLTAWVAIVAEREGFSREAALTFGKAIAGMFAQSKGRSVGIYEPKEQTEEEREAKKKAEKKAGVTHVEVFGTRLKAVQAGGELHAIETAKKAVEPGKVQQYLQRAFKDRLADVEAAMRQLAEAFPKEEIGGEAYRLYEEFRPTVPQGKQGWGRKGRLELDRLLELRPASGGQKAAEGEVIAGDGETAEEAEGADGQEEES